MKKIMFGLVALILAAGFNSCDQSGYKKLNGGMEYKIIGNGKGTKIAYGEVMKYHIVQKYKDSVLKDSRNQPPSYQPVDSTQLPKEYFQIFQQVRSGDSIVIRVPVDSVFKGAMGSMPPQFKKGEFFFTLVNVLGVLKADQAQADFNQEVKKFQEQDSIRSVAQAVIDDQILKDYIAKNNINAVKTPRGAYVEIQMQGSGALAKDGQMLTINYTGRFLDGKAFDSNVDTIFRHAKPYELILGSTPLIKGWDDGLKMFNKGSKGRIFVPSVLAYGSQGDQRGVIKPNDNLVFDIDLVDLKEVPQQTPESSLPPKDSIHQKNQAQRK
jgi:FKBP-type peptidyl-prolyl cis-trans isomerase FkpA